MTRQKILSMTAGKELNQLIASEIFKLELDKNYKINNLFKYKYNWYQSIFDYSESMDNAMLIVELLRKNGIYLTIDIDSKTYTVFTYVTSDKYLERLEGELLPELICKVALLCNTHDFIELEV